MTRKILSVLVVAGVAATATLWPADAFAQRRAAVRRPASRTMIVARPYARVYRPVYYRPYYYDPFWNWGIGFGAGYGWGLGYSQYPYPYPYPRPYGYRGYYEAGSDVRIQVQPRNAEVYLDGYFVGTVDDFDGVFQRLRAPYGEHEVEIYLQGFRTIRQRMMFRPGESYHLKETMQQLPAGEAQEPRPAAQPNEARPPRAPQGPPPQPRDRGRIGPPAQRPMDQENRGAFGTLAIRVQPADAEVTIDGERWNTVEGDSRLTVDLAEGPHRIEIRREGYRPYAAEIRVRRGEMTPLNVSLPRSDER